VNLRIIALETSAAIKVVQLQGSIFSAENLFSGDFLEKIYIFKKIPRKRFSEHSTAGQMGRRHPEAVQVHGDPEAPVQPEEQGERGRPSGAGHAARLPHQGRKDLQESILSISVSDEKLFPQTTIPKCH
jgi:hypothetical protein